MATEKLYELISTHDQKIGHVVYTRRMLLGSSEACDITLRGKSIAPIHAVIEYTGNDVFKIYDMNTESGIRINGEEVIAGPFKIGDRIQIGTVEFVFKNYSPRDLPPTLDMLGPDLPPRMPKVVPPSRELPGNKPDVLVVEQVVYPLAKDPKAEFSEYIFEDVESLYPIFKYKQLDSSIEVIILFKDRIYSVDYLPFKNGVYSLAGHNPKKHEIEFAYLPQSEKLAFVEVQNQEVLIHKLHDYEFLCLGDEERDLSASGVFHLRDNDIVRFKKGDLQIYIRKSDAPPIVRPAPVLRRDKEFWKWMILMALLVLLFLIGIYSFEADPTLDEEKIPDRIATILYQRELVVSREQAIAKTEEAPKEQIQKSPVQEPQPEPTPEVARPQEQPTPREDTRPRVQESGTPDAAQTGEVRRAQPQPGPTNQRDQVRPSQQERAQEAAQAAESTVQANVPADNPGHVDTYQSANFSANLNRLVARGGQAQQAQAQRTAPSARTGTGAVASGDSARVDRAEVSTAIGSLSGTARGQLDESRGAEGLVDRREIFTAGTPFREVVLGGMDPDVIRRILMEHIPQFRHCYQQELDRAARAVQGVVRLDFVIGASGHVTRAGVETVSDRLPTNVQNCVVNVLRGIRFPAPRGGGVVEVSQPMNFYPRGG